MRWMYKKEYYNNDSKIRKEKWKLSINHMFNKLKKNLTPESNSCKIRWKVCLTEVNYPTQNGCKN